ncbi:MAG: hypothetical protein KDK35_05060 [Leptospiraceae bacterium]|nr:hypothetical protein [Leptospiraceae bacterium]MCP5485900.1 hypothetical protein [Spirochaetales bacterium]
MKRTLINWEEHVGRAAYDCGPYDGTSKRNDEPISPIKIDFYTRGQGTGGS